MNKFIALIYFLLSLFGCDVGDRSFVHRTTVDGDDLLYSKAHVQAGVARFECLRSASGQCHYTVFPRGCTSATGWIGKHDSDCRPRPLERFAIATGDSRQLTGWQDFRLCVSASGETLAPDCEMPEPMAAR